MMDRLAELFDDDMAPGGAQTRQEKRAA